MKNQILTVLLSVCLMAAGCSEINVSAIQQESEPLYSDVVHPDLDADKLKGQKSIQKYAAKAKDGISRNGQKRIAPSVMDLLKTALQPVGKTLYVWGGAWNEEDTGGGIESVTLGVSEEWEAFYNSQDGSYNFLEHAYEIHEGLDCSGYIGWLVYNTLENQNNQPSYVFEASEQLQTFAQMGLGTFIPAAEIEYVQPGDIMSCEKHIYLVVDVFEDGSRLILHAAPPGVRFSGTPATDGSSGSIAAQEAAWIMQTYYPDFYTRYPSVWVDGSYNGYDQFRWDESVLSGVDEMIHMDSLKLLEELFGEPVNPNSNYSSAEDEQPEE